MKTNTVPRFAIESDNKGFYVSISLGAYTSFHFVKTRAQGRAFIRRILKQARADWGTRRGDNG